MPIDQRPDQLPDRFYQKLLVDTVDEAVINNFLNECVGCDCELLADEEVGVNVRSVERVYNEYVDAKQDSGQPMAVRERETLGRITNLRSASEYIAMTLNQRTEDVIQMFLWLNEYSDPKPTPSQFNVAKEWYAELLRLEDPNTERPFLVNRPPICWLFRSAAGRNSVEDDIDNDFQCLPCRLGLPDLLNDDQIYETGLDYLCLTVTSDRVQNTRTSNFCHGGYLGVRDIWNPGGHTIPIPYGPPACVEKDGLPEVVCDDVAYRDINEILRVIQT